MARALRLQFEDALYHLSARGNRREHNFTAFAIEVCPNAARYESRLS